MAYLDKLFASILVDFPTRWHYALTASQFMNCPAIEHAKDFEKLGKNL